jgi:hypothetical protein
MQSSSCDGATTAFGAVCKQQQQKGQQNRAHQQTDASGHAQCSAAEASFKTKGPSLSYALQPPPVLLAIITTT